MVSLSALRSATSFSKEVIFASKFPLTLLCAVLYSPALALKSAIKEPVTVLEDCNSFNLAFPTV